MDGPLQGSGNRAMMWLAWLYELKASQNPGLCLLVPLLSDNNFLIYSFIYFRAAPAAHKGSQARGQIRATAAGLHHSHSNLESEPHLWPIYHSSWQWRILNPLSEARDRICNLMVLSRIHFRYATMGTLQITTFNRVEVLAFLYVVYMIAHREMCLQGLLLHTLYPKYSRLKTSHQKVKETIPLVYWITLLYTWT